MKRVELQGCHQFLYYTEINRYSINLNSYLPIERLLQFCVIQHMIYIRSMNAAVGFDLTFITTVHPADRLQYGNNVATLDCVAKTKCHSPYTLYVYFVYLQMQQTDPYVCNMLFIHELLFYMLYCVY